VAPPTGAGLLQRWWSVTTHQLEGDPLPHAHMGGRCGSPRVTQTRLVDLSDRPACRSGP
jgi:hypothetical protein